MGFVFRIPTESLRLHDLFGGGGGGFTGPEGVEGIVVELSLSSTVVRCTVLLKGGSGSYAKAPP